MALYWKELFRHFLFANGHASPVLRQAQNRQLGYVIGWYDSLNGNKPGKYIRGSFNKPLYNLTVKCFELVTKTYRQSVTAYAKNRTF